METPRPPNRAQLCGCRIAFLERGPAAQRMEHLDWNCFLNRFFFVCVFFTYFNLSQNALAKSNKNAVLFS